MYIFNPQFVFLTDKEKKLNHQEIIMNNNNNIREAQNQNFHEKNDRTLNTSRSDMKTTQMNISLPIPTKRRQNSGSRIRTVANTTELNENTKEANRKSPEDNSTKSANRTSPGAEAVSSAPPYTTKSVGFSLASSFIKATPSNHFSNSSLSNVSSRALATSSATSTTHSPYTLGVMGDFSSGGGSRKQIDLLPTRNCSDLIRSLAAKYNNNSSCTNQNE